jgi:hypothetical protein
MDKKIISKNNKIQSKKYFKKMQGKCRISGETNTELLDVHRIKPGSEGGKYTLDNVVVVSCSIHRKIHANEIKVLGWVHSTKGKLLHYIDEEGNEQFV